MRNIIGFHGKIGVGKTTMAAYLEANHGFKKLAYGEPLKKALSELTGLEMSVFTDQRLKKQIIPWLGMAPRRLMQLFATDFVRDMVHPDYFVMAMERQIIGKYMAFDIAVDDVRFPNEAELIRNMGGHVIHLHRDVPTDASADHISENHNVFKEGDIVLDLPQGVDTATTYMVDQIKDVLNITIG